MCSTIVQPPFAVVVFYDLLFCHGGPHLMFTLRRSWWRLCNIWSNGEPHVAHEKTCPGSPAGGFDDWKLVTNGYINLGYYIIETLGTHHNTVTVREFTTWLTGMNEIQSVDTIFVFIWTGCNLVHEYVAMIGKYWEYVRTSQGSARQGFHVVAIMILWNGTHKMEKHMEMNKFSICSVTCMDVKGWWQPTIREPGLMSLGLRIEWCSKPLVGDCRRFQCPINCGLSQFAKGTPYPPISIIEWQRIFRGSTLTIITVNNSYPRHG